MRTIDGLWIDNSKGRFGFSVQAKIYRELGGTQKYNEKVWKAFGDMVGWGSRTFDLKAPQGHLPILWEWRLVIETLMCGLKVGGCSGHEGYWVSLLSRRDL